MALANKAKPAGQKPVTAHPLFPAIVALWFAALIGIGSLVLPQALYDKAGAMMGLGTLGVSARIGVALVAGFAGGALGMFVARKASATHGGAQSAPPRRAPQPSPSIRPISAMEELGSDRLDEPLAGRQPDPVTGRRRSLSLNDESGPSEFLTQVPLPGDNTTLDLIGAEQFDDDAELELSDYEEPQPVGPVAAAPTAIAVTDRQIFRPAAAMEDHESPEPRIETPYVDPMRRYENADADWSAPSAIAGTMVPPLAEAPSAAPRPFSPPSSMPFAGHQSAPFAAAPPQAFAPPAAVPEPAIAAAPFSMPVAASGLGPGVPVMQTSRDAASAPQEAGALAAAARPAIAPFTMPSPVEPAVKVGALSGTALPAMALADLIDRFADALRRADPATLTNAMPAALRQYAPAAEQASQPAFSPAVSTAHEPALPLPAFPACATSADDTSGVQADAPAIEQAAIAPAYGMQPLPTALMPIGYEDGEDGDDDDAFGHRFEFPFPPPAAAEETQPDESPVSAAAAAPFGLPQVAGPAGESMPDSEEDHSEKDDTFGSLLAMKSGFGPGREFVRIEDEPEPVAGVEPVVVFPGTASPGRAAPAADGPSREAVATVPATPSPFSPGGLTRLPFGMPQQAASGDTAPVDRSATEQALRDALAKLQQMSGAA